MAFSIDEIEKQSIFELAVQTKNAISSYVEDLNKLRLEWHIMSENKPALVLPPVIDNLITSAEWGPLELTHLDFHAAASNQSKR